MEKEIEDLLKDRYKVIAPYPSSPYEVGDLVEITDIGTSFHCTTTKEWNTFIEEFAPVENYWSIKLIDDYPHLFRKLEWWEDREVSEMPEYVKPAKSPQYIFKVIKFTDGRVYFQNNNGGTSSQPAGVMLPATESEYLTYTHQSQTPTPKDGEGIK